MRAYVALLMVMACSTGVLAAEIRKGALMQVKGNSMWFLEAGHLTQWQKLKKSGDAAALSSYEEQVRKERDAWQFLNPLTVKVLGYNPATRQANVEMKTEGRMLGTEWFLDAGTLMQKRNARQ